MHRVSRVATSAIGLILGIGHAYAQQPGWSHQGEEVFEISAQLSPGQHVWDRAELNQTAFTPNADAEVELVVSIALQRMYVYRAGELVGATTVSTGKPGKRTPKGSFPILQKAKWHRSNLYSNAPMPFMQRLTWDGIAIHAGHNPGYPASHGCIRVPLEFARSLFDRTQLGTQVSVVDWPEPPVMLAVELDGWRSEPARYASAAPARLEYSGSVFWREDTPVIAYGGR